MSLLVAIFYDKSTVLDNVAATVKHFSAYKNNPILFTRYYATYREPHQALQFVRHRSSVRVRESYRKFRYTGDIIPVMNNWKSNFYRAMHFSAKRGLAIACRLSVCLSVRL